MKQPRQQGSDHRFDRMEAKLAENHNETIRRIRSLKRRLEHIMDKVAELQAAVGLVATDVTTIGTDAAEILTELKALRDAGGTGTGGGISPADLDPIIASLTAVHDSATATAAALEAAAVPAVKP